MKTNTITLTNRRPVKINEDEWPVVASFSDQVGGYSCQNKWDRKLFVRQCNFDGRCLVYGIYTSESEKDLDGRAGYLVKNIDVVPNFVNAVCDELSFPKYFANFCIAKLPAEEI